jgi:predicted SnoaL-like aldol condensation-catalyzing enzyme
MAQSEQTRNKIIVSRLIDEFFMAGDATALERLMAPEYRSKGGLQGDRPGPEGALYVRSVIGGKLEILSVDRMDLVAEGDRVAMYGDFTVRHVGELWGVAATGKVFKHHVVQMWRLRDGKLVEHWFGMDRLGILKKLGVEGLPDTD